MIYEFKCQTCGDVSERRLRVAQRHDPQPCKAENCEGEALYNFNPSEVGFVLKGYGWPTHDARASKTMKEKQQKSRKKARDNNFAPSLQPNFMGQMTETWADAQTAAHDFNRTEKPEVPLDTTSYDQLVEKEQIVRPKKSKPKTETTSSAATA